MTREEMLQLAEKISSGFATEEELSLYNKVFNSFQLPEEEWNEALLGDRQQVIEAIHQGIAARTKVVEMKHRRRLKPWLVAASVALTVIAGTWYWWPGKQQSASSPELIAKVDIPAPERNSAVITLANGEKIYLDSNNTGTLSRQGNITITGKGEGEIQYSGQDQQVSINTIAVPRGSKPVSLGLADGTRVWVDAGSSLQFPTAFPGKQREVSVTGQAYFEVKQDAAKPFFVTTTKDDTRVEVLGTSFNVKAFSNAGTQITLVNGAVNVKTGSERKALQPAEQAQVNSTGNIALKPKADIEQVLSWKTGMFIFDGADLPSIMQELERHYDVDVKFESPVQEKFVFRIARNVPLSDVLKGLAMTELVDFKIEGRTIIVSR